MDDVSVVKIGHECKASNGEDKDKKFFVIRPSLFSIKKWPYQMVDF